MSEAQAPCRLAAQSGRFREERGAAREISRVDRHETARKERRRGRMLPAMTGESLHAWRAYQVPFGHHVSAVSQVRVPLELIVMTPSFTCEEPDTGVAVSDQL